MHISDAMLCQAAGNWQATILLLQQDDAATKMMRN
jgi:hypothetical protein